MKYYKEKAKELTDRCNQITIYAHNTNLKKVEEKISYVNALMEKQKQSIKKHLTNYFEADKKKLFSLQFQLA